jgi:hypothetical protein
MISNQWLSNIERYDYNYILKKIILMGACSTVCVKRKEMTVAIPINELN